MLRIDTQKPYTLVYSLCQHEFLGYLIEPHIVQMNPNGEFSLTYQRIFTNTAEEYAAAIDESDRKIIRLLDELEQSELIKKMHKKTIRPREFFSKVFDKKLFDYIRPKIDRKLSDVLTLIKQKPLYLMSKEGWPVERTLTIADEPASVLFHFRRNEEETRYFPTIKFKGMRIEFMFKNAQVVSNEPAWLLLENTLYFFDQALDGKKLSPFLNKRYISIPRNTEYNYFDRFVRLLVTKHHVYAEGFEIKTYQHEASPILKLVTTPLGDSFAQLQFKYGPYVFDAGSDHKVTVRMEYKASEDLYIFHRIKRSLRWEEKHLQDLLDLGLYKVDPLFNNLNVKPTKSSQEPSKTHLLINWINVNHSLLKTKGYHIEQKDDNPKKFLLGNTKIDLEIDEKNDWFDVNAIVRFGSFEIPFTHLRDHILRQKREYLLPSGEVAIIPEAWFSQFSNFFHFSVSKSKIQLQKHHIGLISDLNEHPINGLAMERKLQRLHDFESIQDVSVPEYFKGNLRSYQKAGYNWFHFLKSYHFGGCLADDMGLGKTIQTLALLQKEKEEHLTAGNHKTSLIIMPTSLIYNWLSEAEKFTPDLKILIHTGPNRVKTASTFAPFDIIFTTYGITRIDESLLQEFYFHYVILDESQNIKNPSSKSFKAVRQLNSKNRLILSGTPVENSVGDLWSQMSFLNPGLLGGHSHFQSEFVIPIEKKKDEEKARRLQALIKPFVLRRTKNQVATELPPKTEHIFYCKMTDEQTEYYEKVKSEYRNILLEQSIDELVVKSQIQVLQGLSKLRQLANHPLMIDEHYSGESGKFENVIHTLENILSRGHKVLIFSQFVKQLDIYRKYFNKKKIQYAYLDGATKNRKEVVNDFRKNANIKLFLISIKAGGVGLNLIEADYVFILDPWWNPAVEQQAIDRSHRIGQTKSVFIYKFITKDSVEEKILALQNRKKIIAEQLVTTEESFVKSLSTEDIKELLT
ncbi:DEAD/DEAH box helicase [Olivibacter sp. SDN3]|uniref:DEAD/DEAH box helicase n=1 Tax=Olivibacter sp. SDN3 TaxID=2764720 RepID=UPI0016517023|nr:DEAD/DEAH box helicase [Olivibacter sp. SDN3]QNL50826.1 DEAD/DEAH box helicase [Olivibacter sp. SDN3]